MKSQLDRRHARHSKLIYSISVARASLFFSCKGLVRETRYIKNKSIHCLVHDIINVLNKVYTLLVSFRTPLQLIFVVKI